MVQVHWKIAQFLEENHLRPQDLEQAALRVGQPLGKYTIQRVLRGDGPSRIDKRTLSAIVAALGELTHQPVQPTDLLEFIQLPSSQYLKVTEPTATGPIGIPRELRIKLPTSAPLSEVLIAEMRGGKD